MTKTLTLSAAAAFALLVASSAYAMQDAGQTGEYDQDETTQCQCGGGGDFMRPLHKNDSKTPGAGKAKKISGPPSNDHVGAGVSRSTDVGQGRD